MARIQDDPYTANHASPKHTLGMVFDGTDSLGLPAKFRYVQFEDAVTYVAGHCCEFSDATLKQVTNDKAGGSSLGRVPAGIALRAMTQNYYGYVLVQGYHASALGDGSVALGDAVMTHASTDGAFDTQTAGAGGRQVGTALAADSGSPTTFPGIFNFL